MFPVGYTNSAFYLHNSVAGFTSNLNTFANCYLSSDSAILNLKSTIFTDTSSVFNNNAGVEGVIKAKGTVAITMTGYRPGTTNTF